MELKHYLIGTFWTTIMFISFIAFAWGCEHQSKPTSYSVNECYLYDSNYYRILEVKEYGLLLEDVYSDNHTRAYVPYNDSKIKTFIRTDCAPLTQTQLKERRRGAK